MKQEKAAIEKKSEVPAVNLNKFQVAQGFFNAISLIGWVVMATGVVSGLFTMSDTGNLRSALITMLTIGGAGAVIIAMAQLNLAIIDIANTNTAILEKIKSS